jgi:lipopolysaccharide transport system ATP-binding protein
MPPAIRVDNLGKCYRVAHNQQRAGYRTLRDTIVDAVKAPFRRLMNQGQTAEAEDFWALKDVSFEVQPGEVVGIIGRNGAGKSTLLKVLSRITRPTKGRVELNGRVGSLLEVGTGFHPELTGRENVYLNGSILGMSQREIDRKFDEIVAFAEIEKFLDTPVKRYSSGMYVRLAFAVAAHLEPEILIIDEVLSVGDAGFQKRCFQKMEEIRRTGRTVLVVSHNLGAIQTLCTRAIQLERGELTGQGDVLNEVARYLTRLTVASRTALSERVDREGAGTIKANRFSFQDARGQVIEQAVCGEELRILIGCDSTRPDLRVELLALSCWSADGAKLFHIDTAQRGADTGATGQSRDFVCRIPQLPLAPGLYHWNVLVSAEGRIEDHVFSAAVMEVLPGDFYRVGRTTSPAGGAVLVNHDWL